MLTIWMITNSKVVLDFPLGHVMVKNLWVQGNIALLVERVNMQIGL